MPADSLSQIREWPMHAHNKTPININCCNKFKATVVILKIGTQDNVEITVARLLSLESSADGVDVP